MSAGQMQSDEDLLLAEAEIERRLFCWSNELDLKAKTAEKSCTGSKMRKPRQKRQRTPAREAPEADRSLRSTDVGGTQAVQNVDNQSVLDSVLVRRRENFAPKDKTRPSSDVYKVADEPAIGHGRSNSFGSNSVNTKAQQVRSAVGSSGAFVDEHRHEVGSLGASALSKKDRRAYEARQRAERGCRPLREQKMPLPMLLGMRKKQRGREKKAKNLALASGMLVRSKRKNK